MLTLSRPHWASPDLQCEPSTSGPWRRLRGGWWHDLVDGGTNGTTYVQALKGDPAKWDQWSEIKRCNPLVAVSDEFRRS